MPESCIFDTSACSLTKQQFHISHRNTHACTRGYTKQRNALGVFVYNSWQSKERHETRTESEGLATKVTTHAGLAVMLVNLWTVVVWLRLGTINYMRVEERLLFRGIFVAMVTITNLWIGVVQASWMKKATLTIGFTWETCSGLLNPVFVAHWTVSPDFLLYSRHIY